MALYQRYKYLCILWGCIEVLCFAGTIYGWGSLVFVLKEEGFYSDLCKNESMEASSKTSALVNVSNLDYLTNENDHDDSLVSFKRLATASMESDTFNDSFLFDVKNRNYTRHRHRPYLTCSEQEERLNLWFSIAVAVTYFSCAVIGQMIYKLGIRITRIVSMCVFTAGGLCIAFATKEIPWLICPGLCGIGVSGMVVYGTNLQICNLFPAAASTIVAIIVGLFDFSTILQQITKVNYEAGISRQYTYIFTVGLHIVLISISTFFFLPKMYIRKIGHDLEIDVTVDEKITDALYSSSKLDSNDQKRPLELEVNVEDKVSLLACLLSATYLLHLFWMASSVLRFVSFIGFLNVFLEDLSGGVESVVSYYVGVFSYVTIFAVVTALVSGLMYDWQRRKYQGSSTLIRKYRPVLIPMIFCGFMSTVVTILTFVHVIQVCFATFIVFTFFRSGLFTVAVAFINEAFPTKYFGVLFGFLQFSAGLSGLVQYAIFAWHDAYIGAKFHVDIFLLILGIISMIHPVTLWWRSRTNDEDQSDSYTKEQFLNSKQNHLAA